MQQAIFSGTSNVALSQNIVAHQGTKLGNVEITRFADGECRVWVKDDVSGFHVFVIQSLSTVADQHLIELCLLGQAIKSLGATHATAVIPWMGYSKQDKEFRKGEAVSAELVAKFIEAAGFDSVVAVELHSETITPYFRIPVSELSTHQLFASELKKRALQNIVVVSPDMGGKSRSERFAKEVGLPIVYLEKTRDKVTGEVTVTNISQDVKNHDVVIFDDIINTGATVIKTSEFLKSRGVGKIYFMATHAVFAGDAAVKLSKSAIDEIVVTDTIALPKEKLFEKLTILSVAPLIAEALYGPPS